MAVAARLAAKFNTYYAEKPGKFLAAGFRGLANVSLTVLTTMVTNAVSLLRSIRSSDTDKEIGAWWRRRYRCATDHSIPNSPSPNKQ